jgi:hypothetical protein
VADEEGDPELLLERTDLLGEARLGDPQPLGRARDALLLCDRDEIPEMPKFHDR